MKNQINPMVAIGIAAISLIVIGFFVWRGTGTGTAATDAPSGPPAEFGQRMGGMPGAGGAPSVPGSQQGGGAPTNAPVPAAGSGSGYLAPPMPGGR